MANILNGNKKDCFMEDKYCTSACALYTLNGKCAIKELTENIDGIGHAIGRQNELLVEVCNHLYEIRNTI